LRHHVREEIADPAGCKMKQHRRARFGDGGGGVVRAFEIHVGAAELHDVGSGGVERGDETAADEAPGAGHRDADAVIEAAHPCFRKKAITASAA